MDILRENTVKSLLSKAKMLAETSDILENNEIVKEMLGWIVEVGGLDKGKIAGVGKGLKGKFWKLFFRVNYLVGKDIDNGRNAEEDFGALKEIIGQVKENLEECVKICFDKKFFELNEIEINVGLEDLNSFSQFFETVSKMFFKIDERFLEFDKTLQKLGLYLKLLKGYSMIPKKSPKICFEELIRKLETLQSEKYLLESKLKCIETLLSETRKENETLNSIVAKVKEKLLKLKFSNTQINSFIPGSSSLTSKLKIQKNSDSILISPTKLSELHKNPNNPIIQKINLSLDLLISLRTQLQVPKNNEKISALKNLLKIINELKKDLKAEFLISQDQNFTPKSEDKNNEILTFKLSEQKNDELTSKLIRKKNNIKLHREQIFVLKSRIRELQIGLELTGNTNMIHIRELWWTFAKEVPVLNKKFEETFAVFTRMLGFSSKDILSLTNERLLKKPKLKFGLF